MSAGLAPNNVAATDCRFEHLRQSESPAQLTVVGKQESGAASAHGVTLSRRARSSYPDFRSVVKTTKPRRRPDTLHPSLATQARGYAVSSGQREVPRYITPPHTALVRREKPLKSCAWPARNRSSPISRLANHKTQKTISSCSSGRVKTCSWYLRLLLPRLHGYFFPDF